MGLHQRPMMTTVFGYLCIVYRVWHSLSTVLHTPVVSHGFPVLSHGRITRFSTLRFDWCYVLLLPQSAVMCFASFVTLVHSCVGIPFSRSACIQMAVHFVNRFPEQYLVRFHTVVHGALLFLSKCSIHHVLEPRIIGYLLYHYPSFSHPVKLYQQGGVSATRTSAHSSSCTHTFTHARASFGDFRLQVLIESVSFFLSSFFSFQPLLVFSPLKL